jgi:hypothetical protein
MGYERQGEGEYSEGKLAGRNDEFVWMTRDVPRLAAFGMKVDRLTDGQS